MVNAGPLEYTTAKKGAKNNYSAHAGGSPLSHPPGPELSFPCPRSRLHSQGKRPSFSQSLTFESTPYTPGCGSPPLALQGLTGGQLPWDTPPRLPSSCLGWVGCPCSGFRSSCAHLYYSPSCQFCTPGCPGVPSLDVDSAWVQAESYLALHLQFLAQCLGQLRHCDAC